LVRRRIIQAFLKPYADGTLDPRLVGLEWRQGNRHKEGERARVASGVE
jgi:hypothetical protein